MKRLLFLAALMVGLVSARAELRSFTIEFGAQYASTRSLDNSDFTDAVTAGKGYIDHVTSVVNVFPEKDCIKLSSSKNNGKFNIHLITGATIIPEYYVINAARYDNNRDAEASIMLNSETVYITETTFQDYRIDNEAIVSQRVSNLIVDTDKRVYIKSITLFYDPAGGVVEPERQSVATPEFIPAGGTMTPGAQVTITCATPDADIFYTDDGSEPTADSQPYTVPVTVSRSCTLKAIALKDGMNPSDVATATYLVGDGESTSIAFFNFNDPQSLQPAVTEPAQSKWVELDGRSFTDADAVITFTAVDDGNTHVRLYHSYDAGCDVRIYDGESLTVSTLNPSMSITRIEFEASESGTSFVTFDPDCGEMGDWDYVWTPGDDAPVQRVVLTSEQQSRLKSLTVYMALECGIGDIDYDPDTQATYYTITGMRVGATTPVPGLYIRVTPGRPATKVVVR